MKTKEEIESTFNKYAFEIHEFGVKSKFENFNHFEDRMNILAYLDDELGNSSEWGIRQYEIINSNVFITLLGDKIQWDNLSTGRYDEYLIRYYICGKQFT